MSVPSTRKAAHWYADIGWPIFPIWPMYGERCGCGNPQCARPGKHPVGSLAPNGKDDATTDERRVGMWWARRPDWNIATSAHFRIDVDTRHNGIDNWRELVATHGGYDTTPTCRTPTGGLHIYFQPDSDYGNTNQTGTLPDGIDVRGHGAGYTLLPPSNHEAGGRYEWGSTHPRDTKIAQAPDWLIELVGKDADPIDRAEFGEEVGAVDVEELQVSALVKALLSGDRSRIDACVVTSLVAGGLTNDQIRAIYLHNAPTDKYASKNGQGDNYLALTIGKARAWLKLNARPQRSQL